MFCSSASVRPEQQPPPIKISEPGHEVKKLEERRRNRVSVAAADGQTSGEPSAPPSPVPAKDIVATPVKPTTMTSSSPASPPGEIVAQEPPSSVATATSPADDFHVLLRTFLFSLGNVSSVSPDPCPSSSGPRVPEEEEEERKAQQQQQEDGKTREVDSEPSDKETLRKARLDDGTVTRPGAIAVSGSAATTANPRQAEAWRKANALAEAPAKAASGSEQKGDDAGEGRNGDGGGASPSSSAPMEPQLTSCTRTTCTQTTMGEGTAADVAADAADVVGPLPRTTEDRHLSSWDKLDRRVSYQPLSTASAASCYDFAGATHPPRSHRRPSGGGAGGGGRRHSLPTAPSKSAVAAVATPSARVLSSLVPSPVKHHHQQQQQHRRHPHPLATIVDDCCRGRYLSLHTSGTGSTAAGGQQATGSTSPEQDLGGRPEQDDGVVQSFRKRGRAATAARRARDALRKARFCGEYLPLESGGDSGGTSSSSSGRRRRSAKPPPPRRESDEGPPGPGLRGCGGLVVGVVAGRAAATGGDDDGRRRRSVASALSPPSLHERNRRRRRPRRSGSASTMPQLTDESSSADAEPRRASSDDGAPTTARVPPPPPPTTTRGRGRRRKSFELTPGHMVELRGADETMDALRDCRTVLVQCVACSTTLACVDDADMVICPECRLVGPNVPPDAWLVWGGDGDRVPGRGRPLFPEDVDDDEDDEREFELARGTSAADDDGEWKAGESKVGSSHAAARSRLLWTQFGKSSRNIGWRQRQPQQHQQQQRGHRQQQQQQPRRRRRSCPEMDMKRAGGVGLGLKV